MKIKPRITDSYLPFDIKKVENHYKSKFVIEVASGALFYSDETHEQYPNSYFLLYSKYDILTDKTAWYVANGKSFADKEYTGFLDDNNEFVHSRYTHDFRSVDDNLFIDGGQDYIRTVGDRNGKMLVTVKIVNGELIVLKIN